MQKLESSDQISGDFYFSHKYKEYLVFCAFDFQ